LLWIRRSDGGNLDRTDGGHRWPYLLAGINQSLKKKTILIWGDDTALRMAAKVSKRFEFY